MYKIAVIGDFESVQGFRALGLSVFVKDNREDAAACLGELAQGGYGIIYITEQLARELPDEIEKYRGEVLPAVILIPGKEGSLGLGMRAISRSVERAVGADIIS